MIFIYNNKVVNEDEIPSTAIEITTYDDFFNCIRRFIKGIMKDDTRICKATS